MTENSQISLEQPKSTAITATLKEREVHNYPNVVIIDEGLSNDRGGTASNINRQIRQRRRTV